MNEYSIIQFGNQQALLAGIRKARIRDPEEFMQSVRTANGKVAVQAVNANFVADFDHIRSILQQSLEARKTGTLLSKKIEIDILLRLACTNQISKALIDIGIRDSIDVLVIAIGKTSDLKAVQKHLAKNYMSSDVLKPSAKKNNLLCSHHQISKEEMKSCIDDSKLASILEERANLLW